MFLSSLKDENKGLFLELCVHLSISDGLLLESEKEVLKAYCREMDLPETMISTSKPLNEIISMLNVSANHVEKKIIIMELLALANVDGKYDEKEKEEMSMIIKGFGIEESQQNEIIRLLSEYNNICEEIKNFLCE